MDSRRNALKYSSNLLFLFPILTAYTHGGCRHMAYTCICACGPSSNVLHYGHAGRPNSRLLTASDIALLDMGAEYHCYTSDVTCSFPANGVFNDQQRFIFETVQDMQWSVMDAMKPGVPWPDMHRLSYEVRYWHEMQSAVSHIKFHYLLLYFLATLFKRFCVSDSRSMGFLRVIPRTSWMPTCRHTSCRTALAI